MTAPTEIQAKVAAQLEGFSLTHGVGTKEAACSIAAINLALTGKLTDDVPDCMSEVIGRWIIPIQDAMPLDMLNGPEWRSLLPHAAGTGRNHETERLAIIMGWMWETVLPQLQSLADRSGFGEEWQAICRDRTADAAGTAGTAARAAARAADAADAAAYAARAARAADAADAAARAARAAGTAADAAKFWVAVNPPALLAKLIKVGD